jgi:hypothetical protein
LGTVLGFAFVPEFLAATSLLEPAEVCRTELKPFLTIFGTRMRAIRLFAMAYGVKKVQEIVR